MSVLGGSRQAAEVCPSGGRDIASLNTGSTQSSRVGRTHDPARRGPGRRRFLAQKCPEEGPDAAQRKKDFEEQRAALVSALAAKVGAQDAALPLALSPAESSPGSAAFHSLLVTPLAHDIHKHTNPQSIGEPMFDAACKRCAAWRRLQHSANIWETLFMPAVFPTCASAPLCGLWSVHVVCGECT